MKRLQAHDTLHLEAVEYFALAEAAPLSFEDLLGSGSFIAIHGDEHTSMRKLVVPAFTQKAIFKYLPKIVAVFSSYVSKWIQEGHVKKTSDDIHQATFKVGWFSVALPLPFRSPKVQLKASYSASTPALLLLCGKGFVKHTSVRRLLWRLFLDLMMGFGLRRLNKQRSCHHGGNFLLECLQPHSGGSDIFLDQVYLDASDFAPLPLHERVICILASPVARSKSELLHTVLIAALTGTVKPQSPSIAQGV